MTCLDLSVLVSAFSNFIASVAQLIAARRGR